MKQRRSLLSFKALINFSFQLHAERKQVFFHCNEKEEALRLKTRGSEVKKILSVELQLHYEKYSNCHV